MVTTCKHRCGLRLSDVAALIYFSEFCHSTRSGTVQSGRMDISLIHETSRRTVDGTISYPEVVADLMRAGVESYLVDYVGRSSTYYAADGVSAPVVVPLKLSDLPAVAIDFDTAAVKAAILDSQRHGQHYRDFTHRVMRAGVQGYVAFLRGKRVTYFGRQGDQHIEWFPGTPPAARAAAGNG